jgi:hypothetical protein
MPIAAPVTPSQAQATAPDAVPVAPVDPKDKRINDLMSKAQRYEYQLQQLEPYIPLFEAVRTKPELVQQIQRSMLESESIQAPASTSVPKMPERPVKPENYDDVSAHQDPTSESFKYRRSVEKYRDDMLQFYADKEVYRTRQEEVQVKQQAKMQEMQQMAVGLQTWSMTNHGLTQADAIDFVSFASNDANVTPEALLKLWKLERGKQTQPPEVKSPNFGPTGVGTGIPAPETSDDTTQFNQQLLDRYGLKKRGGGRL